MLVIHLVNGSELFYKKQQQKRRHLFFSVTHVLVSTDVKYVDQNGNVSFEKIDLLTYAERVIVPLVLLLKCVAYR